MRVLLEICATCMQKYDSKPEGEIAVGSAGGQTVDRV